MTTTASKFAIASDHGPALGRSARGIELLKGTKANARGCNTVVGANRKLVTSMHLNSQGARICWVLKREGLPIHKRLAVKRGPTDDVLTES